MVFTEQKFFQTSNSITNKFEEPCLSVFLSIILEIDLLNDYNYRPTPIFKEKIQNCGSLLFWNRIVQVKTKN